MADVAGTGSSLALRGAGCSYGDASLNHDGHVLDLSGMDRFLDFDRGARPGDRRAGCHDSRCLAAVDPLGVVAAGRAGDDGRVDRRRDGVQHPRQEQLPRRQLRRARAVVRAAGLPPARSCAASREENADVFHAAIGGFGMLGCIVEVTLQLKRVYAGRLRVWAMPTRDLAENLQRLEDLKEEADYLVGWLDLHGRGMVLGRGLLHRADQLAPGEDPDGSRWLDPAMQDVPARMFGVVPKGWIWPPMWLAMHGGAVPVVNWAKYQAGFREARASPYLQTHGAFHFLLDYVPRWHWMTKPGGLIQLQPFVPRRDGEAVLRTVIERCQRARMVPYLAVLKRHRPDPFLMTHALDGYSLAMDFAVGTDPTARAALWSLCRELAEVVLAAGGRFYYAKDAILEASAFARIHGADAVERFRALKQRLDPAGGAAQRSVAAARRQRGPDGVPGRMTVGLD
jgi:FAD/FMN-containing dehydrogenase